MVAISLYRGNLHRVPDVPRSWSLPPHKFSVCDFKVLLQRRSKALSRNLNSSTLATTSSNPNRNIDGTSDRNDEVIRENDAACEVSAEITKVSPAGEPLPEIKDDGADCLVNSVDGSDLLPNTTLDAIQKISHPAEDGSALQHETPDVLVLANPNLEESTIDDSLDVKNRRKREIEEKLEFLNAKKHNLVLVLKQILNVEEELNRRNNAQGPAFRPAVPLQVDVTTDSGSMMRQNASRIGLEANGGGEIEIGEADGFSNLNVHNRQMLRTSSMSPSSESPLSRPPYIQHNMATYPSRASLGAAGSPSRFAPSAHQGHSTNLPTVSVIGTNYIASSPSPATSGGTSVFRDVRQPSPWN